MEKFYRIETYGCQMNVHESEKIAGMLERMGYQKTDEMANASVIVFNTCCIRDTAEKKALGNIGAVKHLKEKNKDILFAVVGCMTQQDGYAEMFKEKYRFVDIVLGTSNLHLLEELIGKNLKDRKKIFQVDKDAMPAIVDDVPLARTSYPNAWVNIMYGCNNFCSYCIVPYVRGRERSRDRQQIISEVKDLIGQGYKEITLLGQNVNSYGNDNEDSFYGLLSSIADIDGKFRLRFMTSHPKDLNKKVVDVIKSSENISNYIHLPVQAGNNRILELMNRKYTREHYLDLIEMIKGKIPDCGISSDIMVGFPTETEEEFQDTLDLVEKVRFSSCFTYIYSVRNGTIAGKMEQIPYSIKQARIKELIALQNKITRQESQKFIGKIQEILVEDINLKKDGYVMGRADNGRLVNFRGNKELIGNFVKVQITNAPSASMYGEIINERKD